MVLCFSRDNNQNAVKHDIAANEEVLSLFRLLP
jgi:hypothetical protein